MKDTAWKWGNTGVSHIITSKFEDLWSNCMVALFVVQFWGYGCHNNGVILVQKPLVISSHFFSKIVKVTSIIWFSESSRFWLDSSVVFCLKYLNQLEFWIFAINWLTFLASSRFLAQPIVTRLKSETSHMAQFFLNRDLRLENTYKKYFLIFFKCQKY